MGRSWVVVGACATVAASLIGQGCGSGGHNSEFEDKGSGGSSGTGSPTGTGFGEDRRDGGGDPNNPTKVFLRGKACDTLKADPAAKIKIVIGCKTVTDVTK